MGRRGQGEWAAVGLLVGALLTHPAGAGADGAAAALRLVSGTRASGLWKRALEIPGFEPLARQAAANTQWTVFRKFESREELPTLLARLSREDLARALRIPEVQGITRALERARGRIGVLAEEIRPLVAAHEERIRFVRAREAIPEAGNVRGAFLAGAEGRVPGVHEFVPGEYRDIRDLALEVLARFPPSRFHYLGIGRSPTPLIAFLEQLRGVRASSIPFALGAGRAPDVSEVDAHLERFLPVETIAGGRSLLAIDLTASGRTLVEFEAALARASARARDGGSDLPYRMLALAEAVPVRDGSGMMAVNWVLATREGKAIDVIPLDRYPALNHRLKASAYDDVAEFESLRVGSGGEPIRGEAYDGFGRLLRRRMENDPEVTGKL